MDNLWNKPHQQLLKISKAHYTQIAFLCWLWLKPALQELFSLWFFLSDSFSIFTPLKYDKATWTIMSGCCPHISFLTAAVPSSLCPWVQDKCCSGRNWGGVLVCLSVLPSFHSPPCQEFVQVLCLGTLSHCWSGNSGDKVSTNGSKLLSYMLFRSFEQYLKQYFYRNSYHGAPISFGYFCTFVIHVLLIDFHWQRRDEPSENDRLFFFFDEKMSLKRNFFNSSLPYRIQKVVSQ